MDTAVIDKKEEVQLTCSFCGGKGKDPFRIMSYLSTCCVCGGKGVVKVKAPYKRCPHCRGTGAIKRLTCTVCRGTGFIPADEGPTIVCPWCEGTGDDASEPAIPCWNCRGRGRISVEEVNESKVPGKVIKKKGTKLSKKKGTKLSKKKRTKLFKKKGTGE